MIYKDLKEKTAVVTGAGKKTGIGFAIARTRRSGCNIVIADWASLPCRGNP